jgi:hypothetical protein
MQRERRMPRVAAGAAVLLSGLAAVAEAGIMTVQQWGRFELSLTNRRKYSDPYRDVVLRATFTRPDRKKLTFWGFHDAGAVWRLRFMPDAPGTWIYSADFSDGQRGASGVFRCVRSEIPGMIRRDRTNPAWFGFRGGRHVLVRSLHVGDRFFASNWPAARRKAFLDWAQRQGYNMLSVASHYLNRSQRGRGAGWDTPDLWPLKAGEWREIEAILHDLSERRIMIYPFAGFFGQGSDFPTDRRGQELYVRYALARIGPYWNVLFNVAGPEPLVKPRAFRGAMGRADINRLGRLIARLDPFGHLLGVHNGSGGDPFRDERWTSFVTLQGGKGADLKKVRAFIAANRTAGKPTYCQEVFWPGNVHHARLGDEEIRKKAFVLLLSGATINFADMNGNSSSGFSGSMDPAERVQRRHDIMKEVWDFFETVPFYEATPRQDLVSRGTCLARPGQWYLVYLDTGGAVDVKLSGGAYDVQWINARDTSDRRPGPQTRTGKGLRSPPGGDDWLLKIARKAED